MIKLQNKVKTLLVNYNKNYLCKELKMDARTFDKRLIDGNYKDEQKVKIIKMYNKL